MVNSLEHKIKPYIKKRREEFKTYSMESKSEEGCRLAFFNLLNDCAPLIKLYTIPEKRLQNGKKPDATIKSTYYVHGYWEAKGLENDNSFLKEVKKKIDSGYPTSNILFSNDKRCILYQNEKKITEVKDMWSLESEGNLAKLLCEFLEYRSLEKSAFEKNKKLFLENVPDLVKSLEGELEKLKTKNPEYRIDLIKATEECRGFIRDDFSEKNIEQWIIQHLLTKQIFLRVFGDTQYHKENNISRMISDLCNNHLGYAERDIIDSKISSYVDHITNYGNLFTGLYEKQLFLKDFYQGFYRKVDKDFSDMSGIVYTPDEIVKFMVRSTDYLLEKYFERTISDKNVHILDPCTGTGTFVTELMELLSSYLDESELAEKYREEIHANEYSVLAYYVANLNIEYTYKNLTGKREKFPRLLLKDTLALPPNKENYQSSFFEANYKRVEEQTDKNIFAIIGNPPYSTYKNKQYADVEEDIDKTYRNAGRNLQFKEHQNFKAVQHALKDSCVKFLRWSSNRIHERGVISFIVNSSFLIDDSGIGIRAYLEKEFDHIYIFNLGGRTDDKVNDKGTNVFDIRRGVAIIFLVKTGQREHAEIKKFNGLENMKKYEKLAELNKSSIQDYKDKLKIVKRNKYHDWLVRRANHEGVFMSSALLRENVIGVETGGKLYYSQKTSILRENIRKKNMIFRESKIVKYKYRYDEEDYLLYNEKSLFAALTDNHFEIWGESLKNKSCCLCWCFTKEKEFKSIVVNTPIDRHYFGGGSSSVQIAPLKWFRDSFKEGLFKNKTRMEVFCYVVGVFNSKEYKEFVEKGNFFYAKKNPPIPDWNFEKYRKIGEKIIKHLNCGKELKKVA